MALLVVLALWGARDVLTILDPAFIMVTIPDMRAMRWIRENVAQDARFLVEGFRTYGGESAVGADAGWWISLLAQRQNTMPPQYALLNEVPLEPDYTANVAKLVASLETHSLAAQEGVQALCEHGVSHVYVGQGRGLVGLGVTQLFAVEELAANPAFLPIYAQDRVRIFALAPDACQAVQP